MTNTVEITKRGRRPNLPQGEEFREIYSKESNARIAEMYEVKISAVQKAARKLGLKKSETGRPGSMPDTAVLEELCKNHTDKQIAVMYKVCPGTVAYWRKKAGINKYDAA